MELEPAIDDEERSDMSGSEALETDSDPENAAGQTKT
jgi:hypothetical protein